jgi:hypothetical protein
MASDGPLQNSPRCVDHSAFPVHQFALHRTSPDVATPSPSASRRRRSSRSVPVHGSRTASTGRDPLRQRRGSCRLFRMSVLTKLSTLRSDARRGPNQGGLPERLSAGRAVNAYPALTSGLWRRRFSGVLEGPLGRTPTCCPCDSHGALRNCRRVRHKPVCLVPHLPLGLDLARSIKSPCRYLGPEPSSSLRCLDPPTETDHLHNATYITI